MKMICKDSEEKKQDDIVIDYTGTFPVLPFFKLIMDAIHVPINSCFTDFFLLDYNH